MTDRLPLIDISRFRGPERDAFLDELRYAAHEVGFFYVIGHGVPQTLTEGIFEVARRFFALPLEQRLDASARTGATAIWRSCNRRGRRAPGARARGVSADAANPLLAHYGENALIGWLRSHPAVAEKWWPDVASGARKSGVGLTDRPATPA